MSSLTLYTPSGVLAAGASAAARGQAADGVRLRGERSTTRRSRSISASPATTTRGWPRCTVSRRHAPSVALATRGGYGLTRLLDRIDWKTIARSVEHGTRWVGLQRCDRAAAGAAGPCARQTSWAGPARLRRLRPRRHGRRRRRGHPRLLPRGDGRTRSRPSASAPKPAWTASRPRGTLWGGNLCGAELAAGHAALPEASRAASCSSRTSTSTRIARRAHACCSSAGGRAGRAEGDAARAASAASRSRRWIAAIR